MPSPKFLYHKRSALARVANARLRRAGLAYVGEVSPTASGIILVARDPLWPLAAVRDAVRMPGCELNADLGIIHWLA